MNYYEELGLARDASADDIKAAYKRLAHETHPDRGGDAERFKRVRIAYEVLSDPTRRQRYDEDGFVDPEVIAQILTDMGALVHATHAAWQAGDYGHAVIHSLKGLGRLVEGVMIGVGAYNNIRGKQP